MTKTHDDQLKELALKFIETHAEKESCLANLKAAEAAHEKANERLRQVSGELSGHCGRNITERYILVDDKLVHVRESSVYIEQVIK